MKKMEILRIIWEPLLITFLLIFSILLVERNQHLKFDNMVLENDLQHTQQQLDQYIDAKIRLGEEKADLIEILRNIELDNTVEFTQHSLYDIEEAFLAVVVTKTVENVGFYYTVRDPFDTTQSLYIYSTLDVEVGTMMVLLELDSGSFVLLEIEN